MPNEGPTIPPPPPPPDTEEIPPTDPSPSTLHSIDLHPWPEESVTEVACPRPHPNQGLVDPEAPTLPPEKGGS